MSHCGVDANEQTAGSSRQKRGQVTESASWSTLLRARLQLAQCKEACANVLTEVGSQTVDVMIVSAAGQFHRKSDDGFPK